MKLLGSLIQIAQESPGVRMVLAGRQHILDEVEKHLAGRAATGSITLSKDEFVTFLRAKPKRM